MKSLAVKYRPKCFSDVIGQEEIKIILQQQLKTKTIKHGYLFCGGAGTGKTTCARIFAHEINGGEGNPIEMDAASNNSVEDIRNICNQAQTQALDCEYKIFILDECHSLSGKAWQAMLKTLEEPPVKSIFIFCTTNPEKIPPTILSRVQRYDFAKVPTELIAKRLEDICNMENIVVEDKNSLYRIARLANGGVRDAITMLDKCTSYSDKISSEVVDQVLSSVSQKDMLDLTMTLQEIYHITWEGNLDDSGFFNQFNKIVDSGVDLKFFIKEYFEFIVSTTSYLIHQNPEITPTNLDINLIEERYEKGEFKWDIGFFISLMKILKELNYNLKYEQNPLPLIVATFIDIGW